MSTPLLKNIPTLPGVYLFKDSAHTIIYIGKAKSLYKRVASYFAKRYTDWKINELIKEHATVDYIVTKNETEALLLEAQLIRDYQPKYNVLLKSGNPFMYVLITDAELPEFKLVRVQQEKGIYFGPFMSKHDVRNGYDYLVRTFRLKLCKSSIKEGCLDYHLDRCAGNCTTTFNPDEYRLHVKLAHEALKGNHEQFLALLEEQIMYHNKNLDFEKSKHLSEYQKNFATIFETLKTRFSEQKYAKEIEHATLLRRPASAFSFALLELQKLLQLPNLPRTLDCFDISHFQSTHIVGSCIRFTDGQPDKNKFRRFLIRSLKEQNDYAALQEIVSRRYKHDDDLPDIIVIDGGKGQLSAVKQIVPSALCISLAKREEQLFAHNLPPNGIKLDLATDLGQLLIALRDYAHHFAISYHKKLRNKALRTSKNENLSYFDSREF